MATGHGDTFYRPQSARTQPGGPPSGRWILFLALAVALVRFLELGEWSLWHDEALALSDALGGERMHNPLGYALFAPFYGSFDGRPSEFWLRFPAAVLGCLTVPLTWWAFRPFAGGRASAAAALLVAVSSWHVYWSQNARFYTLAQALALVGGALLLRGLWRGSSARVVLGVALSLAAASAHPSAAFLLVGLLAAPWLVRGLGLSPPAATSANWRALMIAGAVVVLGGSGWALSVWDLWVEKKSANPAHFLLTTGFYVTPVLAVGVLAGAFVALRRRAAFEVTVFVICSAALAGALGAAFFARMSAQYVFVLLPWLALVAAVPLGATKRRGNFAVPGAVGLAYLALLALPAFADTGLYFAVREGERPRWRDAYRYVFDHAEPGDLILGMEAPVGEYYLEPDPARTDVRRWRHVTYLDRFRADLPDDWARYGRRTWFVINLEQLEDWGGEERRGILSTLARECRQVEAFPVHVEARDLDVLVYLRE